jgi:cytochrome c oxidase subunit II
MDVSTLSWFATVNPVFRPVSPQARALADLFYATLAVCAVIFFIVAGLIAWCLAHFRKADSTVEPAQTEGNKKLEMGWTTGSIAVLIFLFVLTVNAMRVSDPPADRPPDITVIGHQWWWEVHYANGTITANEIHIPTQSNILVRLDSADVIHSFWAPQLGRKIDAIPGHPNSLWIRADQEGQYLGTCNMFCGAQHAWMRLLIVAQSPQALAAWHSLQARAAQTPTAPAAVRGQELFRAKTCVQCHFVRGINPEIEVGPELTHLMSRQTIGSGVRTNGTAELEQWLANPQQIKPGCLMPDFHLSHAEVEDMTAFLGTLR